MNTFNSQQTAAQQYQIRISQALALADAALDVAGCEGIEVKPKYVEALKNEVAPLRSLMTGGETDEFKIGIVGLENAGKSTFINSWLGFDLLPTDSKRATHAPTQILAAMDGRQMLAIEVYTADEFAERKRKLFDKAKDDTVDGRKAKADLEFINKREKELLAVIAKGDQSAEFREYSEVKDFLHRFIADPACAMAVKQVKLYTNHLDDLDGVILYDLPSLNAGLGVDELSERRVVRECDIVIVVQDAKTPTITPAEKHLAKYLLAGEESAALPERMFVFLNGADRCESRDLCRKNLDLAQKEWKRVANLPSENVMIGSSLLGLFASGGYLTEQTRRAHGDEEGLQQKSEHLLEFLHPDITKITEATFGEAVDEVAGVSDFRKRVKNFLREERVALFRTKCDTSVFEVQRLAQIILETATSVYSDNIETAKKRVQDTWRLEFAKWRAEYVEDEIEVAVDEAFTRLHDAKNASAALFEKYQGLIDKHLNLHGREDAIKARIFSRKASNYSHPESANASWRRELSAEIKQSLDLLSTDLADSLFDQLSELLDSMQSKLWSDPKVVEILIGTPELYRARLKAGIYALIMRYSRPLVEATVMSPRDTKLRQDVKTKLRNDLQALSNYAERGFDYSAFSATAGDMGPEGRLAEILDLRRTEDEDAETRRNDFEDLLSFIDRPGFAQCLAARQSSQEDPAEWFEEVEKEVKDDLAFMESFLRKEIFLASGITEFREQEFRRLRDDFSEGEPYWEGIIDNAYERQEPELLRSLPAHLKADEQFKTVSNAIANLKQALNDSVMMQ